VEVLVEHPGRGEFDLADAVACALPVHRTHHISEIAFRVANREEKGRGHHSCLRGCRDNTNNPRVHQAPVLPNPLPALVVID
jgi:hypothetical protein